MWNKTTLIFCIISLLFCTEFCYAQNAGEIRFQVIDASNKEPVVYATVILVQSKVGVISDDNGNFRIPKLYKNNGDYLKISSIGYSTITLALAEQDDSRINIIFLSPKIESLDEVNLFATKQRKKLSARKIVKEAIKRIPNNFPKEPFSYIGYYRDYQQVGDSNYLTELGVAGKNSYINLNEGVIQVYDAGFGTNRLTDNLNQTVLYEFQSNLDFPIDSLLTIPYDNRKEKYLDGVIITPLGGNELNLLHLTNALRNYNRMSFSFVNVLNKHFTHNHYFKFNKMLYLDDEPIYSIHFRSNNNVNQSFYAVGRILISKNNYGIYNLDYQLFNAENNLLYGVNIAYKPIDEQYYLSYITFNNYFEVKAGNFFKVEQVVYDYQSSSFQVSFNEEVDLKSIGSWQKQFQFANNKQPIQIEEVSLIEPKLLNIKIATSSEIEKAILNDSIRYNISKLKDIRGRLLNKQQIIRADQFREVFVQKVFEDSKLDSSFYFVDKNKPLKESKINVFKGKETYWINTPLKDSK